MSLKRFLLGRPLSSDEAEVEKIGPRKGMGIFGLDAFGSVVYGPEAALTILMPLGIAGLSYIVPVSIMIVVLAGFVSFSYLQTIKAYPDDGGTYTVAMENMGTKTGLVAGASLMIDYLMVVAVGISAGTGTLVSIFPSLTPYTLLICLLILLILTIINLRGISETGGIFSIPTYLFIFSLLFVLIYGLVKVIISGANAEPLSHQPHVNSGTTMTAWLFLRTFAIGSTSITGVEAISNGVGTFRDPAVKNARITQLIVMSVLALMLILIAYVAKFYGITATPPDTDEYKSVLYLIVLVVTGKSWFGYIAIFSFLLIVIFQANTSFTGFPRLCSMMAQHNYFPQGFANKGRRLVYSQGILVIGFFTAVLLVAYGGITDRLIPLFAVSALLVFTLSQAGMMIHWKNKKGKGWTVSFALNAAGMIATAAAAVIILISKFTEGAWVIVVLLPVIVIFMLNVNKHYAAVKRQLRNDSALKKEDFSKPLVILPAEEWNNNTSKALSFALSISEEIIVFNVNSKENDAREDDETNLLMNWEKMVEGPLLREGLQVPKLKVWDSPYRLVVQPIVDFVLKTETEYPGRDIALLIPNLVERKWYQRFLHNQRGILITGLLFARGSKRTVVIYVPWYLKKES
jgi:amino acid transporter